MKVPSGSYVLPSDVIVAPPAPKAIRWLVLLMHNASSVACHRGGGSQPYNHEGGPYGMASGGAENDHGGTVPIVAAGGEYVVHPDHVRELGGGDLDMGHRVLDEFVKRVRKENMKTLKKLPGPRRD